MHKVKVVMVVPVVIVIRLDLKRITRQLDNLITAD